MSRTAATGSRALDVAATPSTPLVDASIARAPVVLTQAALGTEKVVKDTLILVAASGKTSDPVPHFFSQVYGWSGPVTVVQSWDDVVREVGKCERIGELLLFSHAVYTALMIGSTQKSSHQFVELMAPLGCDIGSIIFEGCVIGNDLPGLHEIATVLGVPRVQGWTYWHYMDWWRVHPTGNASAALLEFSPLAARAEPYLPASRDGVRTVSVAEQEQAFLQSKLNLIGEYFTEVLPDLDNKPVFQHSIINGSLTASEHRTRASAEVRSIDSAGAQSALQGMLDSARPPFARVEMTPW